MAVFVRGATDQELNSEYVEAERANSHLKIEVNYFTIFILYRNEHAAYGRCILSKYFPDTRLNEEHTWTRIFGEREFAEEVVPHK